jgi:hypothetical protein
LLLFSEAKGPLVGIYRHTASRERRRAGERSWMDGRCSAVH